MIAPPRSHATAPRPLSFNATTGKEPPPESSEAGDWNSPAPSTPFEGVSQVAATPWPRPVTSMTGLCAPAPDDALSPSIWAVVSKTEPTSLRAITRERVWPPILKSCRNTTHA